MAIGWGAPLLIVGAAMSDIDGLISMTNVHVGGELIQSTISYCWVDKNGTAKWFFLGPMLVSIVFNLCISVVVIQRVSRQLVMRIKRGEKGLPSHVAELYVAIKVTMVVTSVTGGGWVLAILVMFGVGGIGAQYLFTIVNAVQGKPYF